MPAFPVTEHDEEEYPFVKPGLSKREYFAAMAMQAIIAANHSKDNGPTLSPDVITLCATRYADALLTELSKPQP